ncbi:ATP-grasp domain-containing protein [Amycolatopsis balhimycina DSM 5908]|uniref:ATP-grasp domain-containing protein n=1 Tax=Amycolatopsis balhimycina DSM 5908 TaxID=1081091 RepID=A0A428X6A3_AMYBA|nr:ATP-grasp domain-containing protein [Amycolatopsis balhimycina]RSM50829.1 ATP-grasp domain-containing protein [Amycolatopsis balhimycina DSM 5908]
MAPRILLIGGNPKHFQAAKAAGLEVVYCQNPGEFKPEYGPQVVGAILADYTDWATFRPLVRAAHRAWGFTTVVSLTEPGLDPAGRVRDLLGLGGPSYEVSHRFTDKNVMRRRIAEVASPDVPVIGAAVLAGRDSLTEFGARHGYPFIVKPGAGTASFGVHRVDGPDDVDPVFEAVSCERDVPEHPFLGQYDLDEYVLEEYVDGTLYSAEAFSFAGRHTVLAITEAVTLEGTVVHAGHAIPARLSAADVAAVERMIPAFLDALEYTDGPSHTEFKLSPRGPVVIESQNRIGGALINEMVHEVHGIDMHELTMKWPHGSVAPVVAALPARGAAASWLAVAEPGEILEIAGVEAVAADPATLAVDLGGAAPGDVVRSLDGSWDGLGHVAVRAAGTTAAIEFSRARVGDIKVRTRPVES